MSPRFLRVFLKQKNRPDKEKSSQRKDAKSAMKQTLSGRKEIHRRAREEVATPRIGVGCSAILSGEALLSFPFFIFASKTLSLARGHEPI